MEKFSKGVILGAPHPSLAVHVALSKWSVKSLPKTRSLTAGFALSCDGPAVVTSKRELKQGIETRLQQCPRKG
jgi:hypothetical protein